MAENKDVAGRATLRQSAKGTKQKRLVSQQGAVAQSKSLASDFGGTKPKFFVSFDTYGNVRRLQEIVGNEPEQRFLIVDANGVDYDLINADSVVGQIKTLEKRWIVDVDTKDEEELLRIMKVVNIARPEGNKIYATIPTKNGYHLITGRFDVLMFQNVFPHVDIQKKNPTLLYLPNSLND